MDINFQESLQAIAEIAVAFAGFTGIVIVFGSKSGSWSLLRLRTLLRASLSALFCSFIPILVFQFELGEHLAWRVSAELIASVMSINLIAFWWGGRSMSIPRAQLVSFIGGLLVVGTTLFSAFGYLLNASLMVLVSLLWQLFVSSQNFVMLLLEGVSDTQPSADNKGR